MNVSAASAGSAAAKIDSNTAVRHATPMLLIAGALLGVGTLSLRMLLVRHGDRGTRRPPNRQDGSAFAPAFRCVLVRHGIEWMVEKKRLRSRRRQTRTGSPHRRLPRQPTPALPLIPPNPRRAQLGGNDRNHNQDLVDFHGRQVSVP